ncbi:MAG TPA: GEVED domain-containing protein, partial [Flavobacteriales bacterium]|nr:GEVED domain-containing protein [Flavobacteriales bacterium]
MTDWNLVAADPEGMGATDDSVNVRISTDCGLSFTTIYSFNAANLNGVTTTLSNHTVPLSAYVGQEVIIGIFATEGTVDNTADYDFHVDDVRIGSPPTCFDPTGLAITGVTTSGFTATWNAEPTAVGGYDWEVRSSGSPGGPGAVASGNAGSETVSLNTLSASTAYTFYVRSNCDGSGNSLWVSAPFFTGYCVPVGGGTSTTYYISNFSTTGGTTNISNASGNFSAGGYGDFTAQSVSQIANGGINFSISINGGSTYGINIWVDWNNDLDFNDAGENVYWSGGYVAAAPRTGSFTVPNGTAVGNYRMRVREDFLSTNPPACGTSGYAEAEDYTLVVLPPPACPFPTGLTASPTSTTSISASWTAEPNATLGYNWEVRTSGNPGDPGAVATGTTGTSSFSTTSGILANTTYQVYVQSDCDLDGVSTWAGPVTLYTGYCIPLSAGSSCISNVTFGANLNNTSAACASPFYTDFSTGGPSTTGSFERGVSYPFTFTSDAAAIASLWIDFNHNLSFEAAEHYQLTTSGTTATVNITIPLTAAFGPTGMRVRTRSVGSANGPTDACTQFFSGEAEDYSITICQQPSGTATVTDNCPNDNFVITVNEPTLASGTI